MNAKKIHDISRKISKHTAVWPGDSHVSVRRLKTFQDGDGQEVSRIKAGLHVATHIDAPLHFVEGAKKVENLDLTRFIGDAKVFEVGSEKLISIEDVKELDIQEGDIVLFKTINSNVNDEDPFFEDFVAVSLEAAEFLVEKKIKAVGIDYLSIEAFFSEGSLVHKCLLGAEVAVIEGLNLHDVEAGEYFLSCLPLRIMNAEASPVRAVLIEK